MVKLPFYKPYKVFCVNQYLEALGAFEDARVSRRRKSEGEMEQLVANLPLIKSLEGLCELLSSSL